MTFYANMVEDMSSIKDGIETLFQRARLQALRFSEKETSTFNELRHIQKRDQALEDSFVEWSKIDTYENLVFDKGAWTNVFYIDEVRFTEDLYSKATYPMEIDGNIIPGSNFAGIFLDQSEYWGYTSRSGTEVSAAFSLPFELKEGETSVQVNRVHLRTNNELDVELLYQETFGGEWISMGTRPGRDHLWTGLFNGVQIKFSATTSVFGVSFVAAGLASFEHSGELISTYYEVDDLRKMDIEMNAEIPTNTYIRKFVHISNATPSGTVADSEWVPWESEDIVTLANNEYSYPIYSGYIIPSGYLEESLVVRDGYDTWDDVTATDYTPVTESLILTADSLTIPAGYLIIDNGIQTVYSGEGESRTIWTKDTDYAALYSVSANTIQIMGVSEEFKDYYGDIYAEVRMRAPVAVRQRRIFVHLENDRDIILWIPAASDGCSIRTLFIGDTIQYENTTENVTGGTSVTISGLAGINLIEVEDFDDANPPSLVGSYLTFAKRYWKKESVASDIEANEFYLEPVASGWAIHTTGDNLWARWLEPTGYNYVAVKFEFEGLEQEAPSLRGYKIINTIDKL